MAESPLKNQNFLNKNKIIKKEIEMPKKRKKKKASTIKEIGADISKVVEKENIDADKLVEEAIEWARKQ
jgi:hypothetical protein